MKSNTVPMIALSAAACLFALMPSAALAGPTAANNTLFGPNVYVFDANMPAEDVQKTATEIFSKMESNQFGRDRYALLFKPGEYNVTFNVGFYTHVAGLGQSPDDVHVNGGVNVDAKWMPNGNATCNFWRTLENFSVTPTASKGTTRIAVSQAAPLRRLHIKGKPTSSWTLAMEGAGWARGGFPRRSGRRRPGRARLATAVALAEQQMVALVERRVEHGLRRLRERPQRQVPQSALYGREQNADHPREAISHRRSRRQVLGFRACVANHGHRDGVSWARQGPRPASRYQSTSSTSPRPRPPAPRASTPRLAERQAYLSSRPVSMSSDDTHQSHQA